MAQERKIANVTVNDGKGLLDNEGLIDSLIVDTNDIVKQLTTGQYVAFCKKIVHMVQKLANLKKGMMEEISSRDARIDELTQENERLFNLIHFGKERKEQGKEQNGKQAEVLELFADGEKIGEEKADSEG